MLANNTMYTALPVNDMQKAMDFYGKTLGLTMIDENDAGTWFQTGSGRIALYYSEFAGTNQGTAAIWEVGDPKQTVKSLINRGVKFEKYDIPNVKRQGYIHHFRKYDAAWFKDSSGNLICITHHL